MTPPRSERVAPTEATHASQVTLCHQGRDAGHAPIVRRGSVRGKRRRQATAGRPAARPAERSLNAKTISVIPRMSAITPTQTISSTALRPQ